MTRAAQARAPRRSSRPRLPMAWTPSLASRWTSGRPGSHCKCPWALAPSPQATPDLCWGLPVWEGVPREELPPAFGVLTQGSAPRPPSSPGGSPVPVPYAEDSQQGRWQVGSCLAEIVCPALLPAHIPSTHRGRARAVRPAPPSTGPSVQNLPSCFAPGRQPPARVGLLLYRRIICVPCGPPLLGTYSPVAWGIFSGSAATAMCSRAFLSQYEVLWVREVRTPGPAGPR